MVKFTPVFALASALSVANAVEVYVRVRNLTYLQPFSPVFVVAHTNDVSIFREGFPASDAIKLMAENGDNSALVELLASDDVDPYICGGVMGEAPLVPGDTWRAIMTVDESICPNAQYSVVSMLVNTNDAFMGIDSNRLVETEKVFPPAFDAGTESNNELCTHIPGPACPADSGNIEDGPGEGFIHVSRGFHGVGPDLGEANYDWRNPVAEVIVTTSYV